MHYGIDFGVNITCATFHRQEKWEKVIFVVWDKSSLFTSSETLFFDKTLPGGESYCAVCGCSDGMLFKRVVS